MPKATRERQGGRSLLGICLSVHMAQTGASDYYDDYPEDVVILKDAKENWEPSLLPSAMMFDAAVLNLIEITIQEYYA